MVSDAGMTSVISARVARLPGCRIGERAVSEAVPASTVPLPWTLAASVPAASVEHRPSVAADQVGVKGVVCGGDHH